MAEQEHSSGYNTNSFMHVSLCLYYASNSLGYQKSYLNFVLKITVVHS